MFVEGGDAARGDEGGALEDGGGGERDCSGDLS